MSSLTRLKKEIRQYQDPEKKKVLQRFFKTGKGEYAEGDVFLGVTVPPLRSVAKHFQHLSQKDLTTLLRSKIHEERFVALLIMIDQFQRGTPQDKKRIYTHYIKSTRHINNWDLVDLSAAKIVGAYTDYIDDTAILVTFAKSADLWKRRIAIIATLHYIQKDVFTKTLKIAEILLSDPHDLIHKAVGWMLREVGKRDQKAEEIFLKKHYKTMPRTMLRYAIEKFEETKRKSYLRGTL